MDSFRELRSMGKHGTLRPWKVVDFGQNMRCMQLSQANEKSTVLVFLRVSSSLRIVDRPKSFSLSPTTRHLGLWYLVMSLPFPLRWHIHLAKRDPEQGEDPNYLWSSLACCLDGRVHLSQASGTVCGHGILLFAPGIRPRLQGQQKYVLWKACFLLLVALSPSALLLSYLCPRLLSSLCFLVMEQWGSYGDAGLTRTHP